MGQSVKRVPDEGARWSPASWWKKRLGVRLTVTLCLVVLAVLAGQQALQMLGLPFTGYEGHLTQLRTEACNRLSLAADVKKDQLLEQFDEARQDVESFAETRDIRDGAVRLTAAAREQGLLGKEGMEAWASLAQEESHRALVKFASRVQRIQGVYAAVHIVEIGSGRVVFSTTPKVLGMDLSRERFFLRSAQQPTAYLDETNQGLFDATVPVSRVCCRIQDGTGRPVGVLVLAMDMGKVISPILHTGKTLGETGEAVLVNEQGILVAPLKYPLKDGTQARPLEHQIKTKPVQMASSGQEGLVEDLDYRGHLILAATRHIRVNPEWGWGLVVKMDRDELMGSVDADLRQTFWFALGAMLLLILVIAFLTRKVVAPLSVLTRTAEQLAAGDRSVRASMSGPDEVGRLSTAFDRMADSIEGHWKTIEDRNRELVKVTESLEVRQRVQQSVLAVSQAATGARALPELLQQGLAALMEATFSQVGAVYLTDPEAPGVLRLAHCAGITDPRQLDHDVNLGEGQIGLAAQRRATQTLSEIPRDTPFSVTSVLGQSPPAQIVSVPLVAGDQLAGVVALASLHAFGEENWAVVDAVKSHLATAISNAQSHARTSRLAKDLRATNEELTAVNEELKAQSEELREQAEELRQQSEELRMTASALDAQRLRVMEADRLKSEFLSNMSHELRTPLNSILALSQLMQSRGPGKAVKTDQEHLAIIERNGRNLLRLINDILDLSKIEAGRMDLNIEEVDLSAVVTAVAATARPLAQAKHLEFHVDADLAGRMRGDGERLRQILLNLLSNAVKFTDHGSVSLSVAGDEKNIRFEVKDTGIGIAADQIPHLFDEFRQVDGSSSRRHEGTGLGLAICRRLAGMMGGDVRVESKPGQGSTFTLILPREFTAPAAAPSSAPQPVAANRKNLLMPARSRVLVVDDDPEARRQVATCLIELGYAAVEASSGADALRLVHEERPHAITLDVLMPGMDGWEVLRQLKGQPETATIPVIVVSVSDDRVTGAALGAVGYVTKPVDREELRAALREIARRKPVRRVLIVDDDPLAREQMQSVLNADAYIVQTVPDGTQALRLCQEYPPDALVLDLVMPGLDGFEVLQRLRSWTATRELPVIVVTAKDLSKEEREQLAALAQKNLFKGENGARLRRELKTALESLEPRAPQGDARPAILVVEDNEVAALQIRTALEEGNFRVTVAPGGAEALAEIVRRLPDGIVLDLMMPKVDGFTVLESIRATPWAQAVPVLVLTAKELTSEDRKRLKHNHIKDLIQKGAVDRARLIEAVSAMVHPRTDGMGVREYGGMGVDASALGAPTPPHAHTPIQPVPTPETPSMGVRGYGSMGVDGSAPDAPTPTPAVQPAPAADTPIHPYLKTPIQILVVEDHPDNRIAIQACLEAAGMSCQLVGSADEALRAARELHPALILMDVQLPGMSGLELARRLKADPACRGVPIVALTAKAMKGDREAILAAGCDDYVSKPFDPPQLIETIGKWVGGERE